MITRACCLLVVLLSPVASAAEVSVAVSSNFSHALEQVGEIFERETGHRLRASPASSGKHFAQIVNGAPFDVFLSADAQRPGMLEQRGLAVPGSRFVYARGRLVLWAPRWPDGACREALGAARFERIAIAHPRNAPYGTAAKELLREVGVGEQYRGRKAVGENVSQALQFAESGAADAALVARSLWLLRPAREQGCHWEVPDALTPMLGQEAVLLQRAASSAPAREFLTFLRSAEARRVIESAGYALPD